MCFSEKASIISFSTGILGAILCISLGTITDKIIGYYFGFISLMQLIEYLLWRHQKCDDYNRTISFIGMILNNIQPIILGVIIFLVNPENKNKKWITLVMFIYLCVIIPYSAQFINKPDQCTLKNEKNKHLMWQWYLMDHTVFVYSVYLITVCLLCILGFPKLKYGIYAAIVNAFTYTTSLYFYPQKVVGALWCYYSVFLPIIYYFIRILFFTHL